MAIEEEIGQEFQEEPMAEMPVAEEQPVEEEVVTEEEVIEAPAGEAGPGTPPKKQQGQVQILPGKGGQKTVVSGVTPKQPQQQQPLNRGYYQKQDESIRVNIPEKPVKQTREVTKIGGDQNYGAAFKEYEDAQDRLRLLDKNKAEWEKNYYKTLALSEGYGVKMELPEQFSEERRKKLKIAADVRRNNVEKYIDNEVERVWNEEKKSLGGAEMPFLMTNVAGIKVPDAALIDKKSNEIAKKYGLKEDGIFSTYFKAKLRGMADYGLYKDEVESESAKRYKQKYGESLTESKQRVIDLQNQGIKLISERNASIEDLYKTAVVEKEQKQKTLESDYIAAVDIINEKIKQDPEVIKFSEDAISAATMELQKRINEGLDYDEAVAISQSEEFKKALDKKVAEFTMQKYKADFDYAFDAYASKLNQDNSYLQGKLKRKEDEILMSSFPKLRELDTQIKSMDKKLSENYGKISSEVYKEVRSRRNKEIADKSFSFWESGPAGFIQVGALGTMSAFGSLMKTYGATFDSPALRRYGEILEAEFRIPEDLQVKSAADLLDLRKFAGSTSQIYGRALPGIAIGTGLSIATRGAAVPLATELIMGAVIGAGTNTIDVVGGVYNDVLERTGSYADADKAATEMFKGELMTSYQHIFDGFTYFGGKTLSKMFPKAGTAKKLAAGITVDTALELAGEIPEGAMEKRVTETLSLEGWEKNVTAEESYQTFLTIIPSQIAGNTAPVLVSKTYNWAADSFAKRKLNGLLAKENTAEYIKDNKTQYLFNLNQKAGPRVAKQYAVMMFASGNIDKKELERLTKKVDDFENFKSVTKKAKLTFADNVAGFSLYDEFNESKAALDAEKDPAAKIMLQQRFDAAKSNWEAFSKGEGTNAVVLNMPSGETFVLSPEDADKMLEDDAVKQDIKDGKIGVQVFAKKGEENTMQATADKMNVLFEQKPTLTKFTSPTDEKYGTVNRNDGKGEVTLTKEEFLREQGAISGVQEGVEGVPSAEPTEAGAAPTAMGEEGAKAEGVTKTPEEVEAQKVDIEGRRQEELRSVELAIAKSNTTGEIPVVNGEPVNKNTINEINAKYDAELTALEKEQAVTPEPAAPEGTKPESLTKPSELFDRVDLNEALEGEDLVNNIDETERKFSPEKMKQAGVITDNFDTIMRDMEKKGKIKIDCPPLTKASKGLAIGFIPGGTWEVVETFSGPTHKEGGIKIEIEGTEISYADADEEVQGKAKDGGFWSTMKNVGLFLGDTGLTALGHVIRNNSLKNVINEENYGSKNWDNASRAVAVGVSGTTLLNPNKVINEFNMMKMESEMNKLSKEATKKQKELDWAKKSQPYSSETKMNIPNTPEPIKPKKTDLGDSSSQDNIIKPSL